jgi:hypothetical protein
MSDPAPANRYARRWQALLTENTIENTNFELISSFTRPLSPQQIAQVVASTARREKISRELGDLVAEWRLTFSQSDSVASRA